MVVQTLYIYVQNLLFSPFHHKQKGKRKTNKKSFSAINRSLLKDVESQISSEQSYLPELFQFLDKDDIDSIVLSHALMKQDIETDAKSAIDDAIIALSNYQKASSLMIAEFIPIKVISA